MTKEELKQEAEEYVCKRNPLVTKEWFIDAFKKYDKGEKVKYLKDCEIAEYEAYLAGAEPREKRIAELEQKLEQTEKDLADYQFNYPTIKELQKEIEELKKTYRKQRNKRIDELQKENAELKSEKGCETCTKFDEVQLTKAKEIVENFLKEFERMDVLCNYQLRKEAEQFLKDGEVEK